MSQHGSNYKTLNKAIEEFNINLDILNENRSKRNYDQLKKLHKQNSISLEDIIFGEYSQEYKGTRLKERLIEAGYKEYKCENCGLSDWLGNPIPLHLHHKDGNHNNNLFDNLELLCPNCHSLTDTYAGKNIKHKDDNKDDLRLNKKPAEICPICNKNLKTLESDMCFECYKKSRLENMNNSTNREQLKKEIRTYPMTEVGRLHGVTDNAIRKWCKKFGLPSKVKDIQSISDEDWEKL